MKRSSLNANPEKIRQWQERSQGKLRAKASEILKATLKRSPIARQKEVVVKRKRIKAVSKKRAAQNKIYSVLRVEFLEANQFCRLCMDMGRARAATQVHHMAGREGERLNDVSLFLATCGECHDWIEANGLLAIEQGYSVSRHRAA